MRAALLFLVVVSALLCGFEKVEAHVRPAPQPPPPPPPPVKVDGNDGGNDGQRVGVKVVGDSGR